MNTHFNKLDANNNEIKKYYEFCSIFGHKQLTEVPTRVICISSTMFDHILASFPTEFHSTVPLMLDFLIMKLHTVLEESPEEKKGRISKLDAVC